MRPIFLVVDPPDPETLSTRKLILESEKYNVLTATDGSEAAEIADAVPLDCMILHQNMRDSDFTARIWELRTLQDDVPLIVVSPNPHPISNVDHVLPSGEPLELVNLVRKLLGNALQYKHSKPRQRS